MEFPNLRGVSMISVDTETYDPLLKTKGPSCLHGEGHLAGVSIAFDTGFCRYFPLRHPSGNVEDPEQVKAWLRDILSSDIPKIGANIGYDYLWLRSDGIDLCGPLYDVIVAEYLIDETEPRKMYCLDGIALKYLGYGKEESLLEKMALARFGCKNKHEIKASIWKLDAGDVRGYAEMDAKLPLQIWEFQKKEMLHRKVMDYFLNIEVPLTDVLLAMTVRGVRVDVEKAESLVKEYTHCYEREMIALSEYGSGIQIKASRTISPILERLKIPFERTETGEAQLDDIFFSLNREHPFCKALESAREYQTLAKNLETNTLTHLYNGRVHPTYSSTVSEGKGAITGRIISSHPNIGQIPTRSPASKKARCAFIPEEGGEWVSKDWSQQEPRLMLHYAHALDAPGIHDIVRKYKMDPKLSYHKIMQAITGLSYSDAKAVNLGIGYGMGTGKYALKYNKTKAEAERIIKLYHQNAPFVKKLIDTVSAKASMTGFVRTIGGRNQHFTYWEPTSGRATAMKYDKAVEAYGENIKRAYLYRALNKLIQASAADMLKVVLVELHRLGLTPWFSVYDEVDFCGRLSQSDEVRIDEIMLNTTPLVVPLAIDTERGRSWGEIA